MPFDNISCLQMYLSRKGNLDYWIGLSQVGTNEWTWINNTVLTVRWEKKMWLKTHWRAMWKNVGYLKGCFFCFFFCWQNISNNFSTPKKEQKILSNWSPSELLFPTHWKCPGNGYIQKLACSVNLWPGGGDDFWKGGKKCSEHFTIRFL